MKRRGAYISTGILFALLASRSFAAAAPVTLREEQVIIPTYLIGAPDPDPQFYFGGASQGAQHRIYPYPAYDNLTTEKVDKPYKMVYLENEYIRVGILPEIGGKIFEAIDKTNGYNFFYRQHVIKPALISLLGAWISGGVEWDIPHHHRATSFLPIQYTTEERPDGGKTVWVGELELRDRMRWAVGITLRPGKSTIEASFRIVNRTPVPVSMLCFSNVAVSVNDTYQVIFPPSTQHVTYHGKRDFTTWPIATTPFNSTDFSAGVDVSWYKNHYNSNSMFAWNYQDDFFAGYDHGRNVGTMSIADHHAVPGKKFWTWGNNPYGRSQDTLLTDNDGPYIELMVGAYSDNQPDYSWLQPYETREWTEYWYPFRDINGVKKANTEAAVNVEVRDGKATVGFCSTANHPVATVSVSLAGRILLEEQISIHPGKPYRNEVALPQGADEHDLRATLSVDGKELVSYSPIKLQPEPMPPSVKPPLPPDQLKTTEELYLTGLRIEQFRAPGVLPDPYWREALRRDPGDVRVNTALGIDAVKAGRYADAEQLLRKALERDTDKYTSPKNGEPFYYLGLALKGERKTQDAFDQFFKATWSAAWRDPAYFELAQIASIRGDYDAAIAYVDRSLESNALNIRALALRAAILRQTGRNNDALAAAAAITKIDPLDVHAMAEQWLASGNSEITPSLLATIHAFPATALEVATDDMDAGLWHDGRALLEAVVNAVQDKSTISPLIYYDLGYFTQKMNDADKAIEYYHLAAAARTDYVFPFQMEMIDVLEDAMHANPADSHAPYYLGNLLFDSQPERAIALWKQSASMGADFPMVYANLAMASKRKNTAREEELAYLEKAVECGGTARVFNELDQLYEENAVAPDTRLALMEKHQALINRDDIIAREINLMIFAEKYDAAINLLKSRFFRAWEGGSRFSLGDAWVNANLLRGHQHLKAGLNKDALADYQAAMLVPPNLQDATGDVSGRGAEICYWIGKANSALGNAEEAHRMWQDGANLSGNAATKPAPPTGTTSNRARAPIGGLAAGVHMTASRIYYQALCLEALGQGNVAKPLFQQLIDTGNKTLIDAPVMDALKPPAMPAARAHVADAHYIVGLGQLGLGNKDKAKAEFDLALKASPDHLAAKTAMASIEEK